VYKRQLADFITMTMKTELEWAYTPVDFFEAPTVLQLTHGQLSVEAGKAILTLALPTDPLPRDLLDSASEGVRAVFEVRQLLTHAAFTLTEPTVVQHSPSGRAIYVSVADVVVAGMRADVIITDAAGKVITDTGAERIASDTAFVSSLTPKLMKSPTLRLMARSYGRAVQDPSNELVHLYEVRDAAAKYYGKDSVARSTLGVPKAEWQELGHLANDEPLRQGRHRGRQLAGLRDATPQELDRARSVARRILEAFAATV
jgi:hypothetical protein